MSRRLLTLEEIEVSLPPGWQGDTRQISRVFVFSSYAAGLNFTVQVAQQAEAADHHPDLLLGYRQVRVSFYTHDRGGVTPLDIAGARAVNDLAATLPA